MVSTKTRAPESHVGHIIPIIVGSLIQVPLLIEFSSSLLKGEL